MKIIFAVYSEFTMANNPIISEHIFARHKDRIPEVSDLSSADSSFRLLLCRITILRRFYLFLSAGRKNSSLFGSLFCLAIALLARRIVGSSPERRVCKPGSECALNIREDVKKANVRVTMKFFVLLQGFCSFAGIVSMTLLS